MFMTARRFSVAVSLAAGLSAGVVPAGATTLSELQRTTHYHGLSVDPADATKLYLATHHGFFAVTADGNATLLSPVQDFMGFTPHPTDPGILYASGHPAGGGNLGLIVSVDGGATWMQMAQGVGGPVDFHQMDISPADPKVLYGVFGGLQVSRDGGLSWALVGSVPADIIDLSASAQAAERLYAATKSGLMRSDDGGQSWANAAFPGEIVSLIEPIVGADILVFVVGRGLFAAKEGDLGSWTPLNSDFGERILLHLASAPSRPELLYAATTDNELLMSRDGGRSWSPYGQP